MSLNKNLLSSFISFVNSSERSQFDFSVEKNDLGQVLLHFSSLNEKCYGSISLLDGDIIGECKILFAAPNVDPSVIVFQFDHMDSHRYPRAIRFKKGYLIKDKGIFGYGSFSRIWNEDNHWKVVSFIDFLKTRAFSNGL